MTAIPTIADRVAELRATRADQPASPFDREQAALSAAGQPDGIAPVGTRLPDSALADRYAAPTTLSAVTGGQTAVLVFYRGAWCPYCNIALATYQEQLLPAVTARGIPLVAISPQHPDGSLSMRDKHHLAFAVVSDPGNTIARVLGILTQPSDEARAAQLHHGLDLTAINADATTTLPMPTVAIVDADRTVRWIDVHPDYSTRTESGRSSKRSTGSTVDPMPAHQEHI